MYHRNCRTFMRRTQQLQLRCCDG